MLENGRVSVMVLNATFNNISVFIYGEDWTIREKKHRPTASHTLSHNVVSSTLPLTGVRTHNVSFDGH
jgi:hypothetical protein